MKEGQEFPSQMTAARLAGFLWVATMASSMIAEIGCFGQLIVSGDAAKTTENIAANQFRYRLGTALMILTSAGVGVLIWAFYVLLKKVNASLAVLALIFRVVEVALTAVAPASHLTAVRYLGKADYLSAFGPGQLQALSYLSINAYGSMLYIGFFFLGVGSTVFAWLFLKSGYVPKGFAYLGIIASSLMVVGAFAVFLWPPATKIYFPYGMVPMFFYEVGLGLWLWIKGVKIPTLQNP